MRKTLLLLLLLLLLFSVATFAQNKSTEAEERTARQLESIRKSSPELLAFLLRMPKGGDLHNHLSGSIYAESYIKWSAEKGLCVDSKSLVVLSAPCDEGKGQQPMANALNNALLYRQLVDAWSMRNWQFAGKSGHDQFFDAFAKFGVATYDQTGRMLADAAARAARGRVSYLELMLTPDGGVAGRIGGSVKWDGSVENTLQQLRAANIAEAVTAAIKNLRTAEAQKDEILRCGKPGGDPGCDVAIRYVSQVSRGSALNVVFAQMVTGFTLASDPTSKVVAVNLVQPEDGYIAITNFNTQMQMLRSLRKEFPKAHVTLHAGEFGPGMIPPDQLSFHIRDSVEVGGAERIGHGVDIMHETDPYGLLKQMAAKNVMVEICLSSNDVILGVRGSDHPLAIYMKYGVPVALATDDEGVARSEISNEFLRAVQDQGLNYRQLKTMVRNSLTYAFIDGRSLWSNPRDFSRVSECARDTGTSSLSPACGQFLKSNEKARLQFQLEEQLSAFENAN
jgi:adenosine deaminase/adenosine deaminase CECR1